eukprot:CAMPEP_0195007126 /NCGR_PEP_ID=MMETSP0326_2-20130528/7346_1 /TAXON_ID=2866 ORGANISM="Crypthecodinium cohnii, Strain Seligo" /NCGR_SAMPLE_ID=MMETSP0326_2 /ASSEMBLY_ACC=CAM_ASM_000348 /LENGTH=78 /DNA_ID=CAMNT_0040014319 /DNA_START=299 /DNA_END=535 /DNA_ORIENTATION=-
MAAAAAAAAAWPTQSSTYVRLNLHRCANPKFLKPLAVLFSLDLSIGVTTKAAGMGEGETSEPTNSSLLRGNSPAARLD